MSDKEFDINNDTYVEDQVDAIRSMYYATYATIKGLQENLIIERPRRITREQIRRALDNPYENIHMLQQASSMLQTSNGIYQEVITYQSNMLTNDHLLVPVSVDKITSNEDMIKSLNDQSVFLSKYNIKYNTNWIIRRVIEQGELFVYKVETSDGIVLQEIPATYCKITSRQNNVFRWAIDLTKLSDKTINYMPKEIQIAYKKSKKQKMTNSNYYEVGENGVAFPINESYSKNIPYYAAAFDDFIELEDKKDLKNKQDILDSIVLIHQKCPYNKENGKVLISTKHAKTIHEATKSNLPKNAKLVTHHLDTEIYRLSDGSKSFNESVKLAEENAFGSTGINAELFNGKKNTKEAIVAGIVEDSILAFRIQAMVANWINYELSKNKKKGIQYRIKFIDSTIFNKDAKVKSCRDDMAYGGSRLEFIATKGYEPNEGISLLKMENLLGLDKILVPQKSAHTLSKNDNGRPKNDEISNNTEQKVEASGGE
ncbi:hypothetical protein [Paraclostridium sordellii]|uniref:hypothetical protein n=1 Tax=Paraclostridium sordellii TaxID=1505 RepID=UPI0022E74274|nr:hypothetical protein [Paeniclostridium sordellii]